MANALQTDADRRGRAQFAALLARGAKIKDAGDAAGLSRRTAYRWGSDPRVQAMVRSYRARILDRVLGQAADAAAQATQTLVDLLDHSDAKVRVAAASRLLTFRERVDSTPAGISETDVQDMLRQVTDTFARHFPDEPDRLKAVYAELLDRADGSPMSGAALSALDEPAAGMEALEDRTDGAEAKSKTDAPEEDPNDG